ncbi:MAG TPA: winged helix-turn-helix domain-containing protein [Paludibacter sp.]
MRNKNEDLQKLISIPLYKIGAYTIDVMNKRLILKNESVKLTNTELYLIIMFATYVNKMLIERKDILNVIWGEDAYRNARSLDVYICKMRKLLSKDSDILIINISKKGYRIIAPD